MPFIQTTQLWLICLYLYSKSGHLFTVDRNTEERCKLNGWQTLKTPPQVHETEIFALLIPSFICQIIDLWRF